ncbi:MAG: N-acetylmuramoyl-L-alanine amidase [Bosea sp. (in: a-proteobacteria)]
MAIGKPSAEIWLSMAHGLLAAVALSCAFALMAPTCHAQQGPAVAGSGQTTVSNTGQAGPVPVVGVDARLDAAERSARFRLTLSASVELSAETLTQPMRIVIGLPELNFQAATGPKRTGMLLTGFRAGLVAPGRSRIVFDVGAPARISNMRQIQRADGIVELQIDFEAVPSTEFEKAAAEATQKRMQEALLPLQVQPRSEQDRRPLVMIDPGHGGIDPGAVAVGNVTEKSLVLAIGLKLKEQLEGTGAVRVQMTRADDRFLSLSERVRIAREARADLFVSLHADSLSAAQDVRGATIYTGSEKATDAESARLAQKENAADALGGVETFQAGEAVTDILMDLARRETRAQSSAVAAKLVTELSGAVRMHRIPQRAAGFRVLTAPDVPSILIELGFLSSKNDTALLTSAEWQRTAAEAIVRAVNAHFSPRSQLPRRGASFSP